MIGWILLTAVSLVYAQAEAQKAFQDAKTAYQAGNFVEARDLAEKAAQTDPKNPEAFLLLGQALYQLGQVDDAVAAWKQTLALAPKEAFAKQMLELLQAQRVGVDVRITFVETLLAERLFDPATQEIKKLQTDKAISETQRTKLLLLQAESMIGLGKPLEAEKLLREVMVLYPRQADLIQTSLLLGRAKLSIGGQSAGEGLILLKKIVAEHPDSPAATAARLELAVFDLKRDATPAKAEVLAKWIGENPKHVQANEARRVLVESYINLSKQGPKPSADSALNDWDRKALAAAVEFYQSNPQAESAKQLTENVLLGHLFGQYFNNQAFAADLEGLNILLNAQLPREKRLDVLRAIASCRTSLALKKVGDMARKGELPGAKMDAQLPEFLVEAIKVIDTIDKEYPSEPAGKELRLRLAVELRALGQRMAWPDESSSFRGTDTWAAIIALPVIKSNTEPGAVKQGVDIIQGIINEYAQRKSPDWRQTRVSLSRLLANDIVSLDQPVWSEVMQHHAELLSAFAKLQFEENQKAGVAEKNEKPSNMQKELLETLHKRIDRDAAYAAAARALLQQHLVPWAENHHWAVVDEMYSILAGFMPLAERRQTETALVNIWVKRVFDEHDRLLKAGLTVPRRLDPLHEKAVKRLYELQAGLDSQSPDLKEIRDIWSAVIAHYAKRLEYDDVAEAAINIKADKSVAGADEFAAFQMAQMQTDRADREFARLDKQYGTAEKIGMTPGYKNAMTVWMKFITDHQASPLITPAVERIYGIAQVFERHQAYAVAAQVYAELAKFATGVKVLAQAIPNVPTVVEKAAFAQAVALDAQARKLLHKAMAERKGEFLPPEKLSEEFAAAISADKGFISNYSESPFIGDAIGRIMGVGVEYAKLDAWEVAESVYADLLGAKLNIRRPERLEFARGLCQLGRAMPDHAREILSALSLIDRADSSGRMSPGMVALGDMSIDGVALKHDLGITGSNKEAKDWSLSADALTPATGSPLTPGGSGAISLSGPAEKLAEAGRDAQLLAMIQTQEAGRARQVAQIRENATRFVANQPSVQQAVQSPVSSVQRFVQPALSDEELARQDKALTAAYAIFQSIRKDYPTTPTAEQARGEIMIMAGHWRELSQWLRAAQLTTRFLADNPTDAQLPQLRLEIAHDRLSWAAKPLDRKATRQELLAEVASRFDAAREDMNKIIADFPKERTVLQDAQWDIATSYLTEARAIDSVSPTLARGQYVRTAKELAQVALKYPDHPRIGSIGQMLWDIAGELAARNYDEEAIAVWEELLRYDPLHGQAQEAAMRIAQTYQHKLKRPLRAAEVYQELNFIRGGNDQGLQNAIFQIGSELKDQKRWVEALNVLETFTDSFPRHPQAGQALTMAGQIHQANEAWADAIAAYRRVIDEFRDGQWVQDAKWSVAECTINLSQWPEAMEAYRSFVAAYPSDGKVAEANRRIEILKDLVRYQALVDEKGQRKAFEAQFQIAEIMKTQLNNPIKAIIEYRKVAANWPESYRAAEALYAVGEIYLSLNETAKAREALYKIADKYPDSSKADAALYLVGKSYEDEADKLASVTREQTLEKAQQTAQRGAYDAVQVQRRMQQDTNQKKVASLKAAGKGMSAELEEAANSASYNQLNGANVDLFAQKAEQQVESLTATQLADRQDKINAALRKAVDAYTAASKVAGGDKAGDALLQMATIYDKRLKDSKAAMQTWLEIVRQFSGTNVAEDASWKIAQFDEREGKYAEAIDAYQAFLRNYRRSPNAGLAQFAVAENYEHLGQWVNAMDAYTKYIASFQDGPLVNKAKEQINWIKTYRL